MNFIGIDLGTSGVKTILIDEAQTVIASAHAALSVETPSFGWSEQDPLSWIEATKSCLGKLQQSNKAELAAARGIGLSGHMHGATLIDEAGTPLRPCILWNDTRSHREATDLDAIPGFRNISGNIVFPGFTAPKINWVRAHEPHLFQKIHKVLLPKDFLRLWLTGEFVSEMSDAAGTSWLDVSKRDWSDELLEATYLTGSQMPTLVEGSEQSGVVRKEIYEAFGWLCCKLELGTQRRFR